jgi:DNA-binding transcriptional ArsR family regulator
MKDEENLLCNDFEKCIKASEFFSVLSNPGRVAIICFLTTGRKSVSEIVNKLNLPQSSVSLHLARLSDKGWIKKERVGKNVYYEIKSPDIEKILLTVSDKFINNLKIERR